MREIRRILYVRTDRLGDVLMNLPALNLLRQSYPKAGVTLVADRSVSGFFKDHPDLDEVMEVDAAQLAVDAKARRELVRQIRRVHYDLAVISNSSKFFHWLSFICGIPLRVGWRRKWAFFLNRTLPDEKHKAHRHETEVNLSLLGLVCPGKWSGTIRLVSDEKASEDMKKLLDEIVGDKRVIAVHAGTSHPGKRWPKEKFIELCRQLQARQKGFLVFIGGEEEVDLTRQIIEGLRQPAMDLCGKTSWKQLAAFFLDARVRTLVSSDSGPLHVAWMCGKPVVAFYAKNVPGSDPARWGPRDGKSEVIFKDMNEITVEESLERIDRALSYG